MGIILASNRTQEVDEMRNIYCNTLIDIAIENKDVVVLHADLMSSMGMVEFFEKFPERTFNVGIQEANMIGVAAGLSAVGKIPFVHSFGSFVTRRCFDQLFLSAAYSRHSLRVVGSDPGVTAEFSGGTHMPFEDMGIVRNIPGSIILEPVDGTMLDNLVRQTVSHKGFFYIRLLRKNAVKIYENGSMFEIGKGIILKEGKDVTIIATGIMVDEALKAAEILENKKISTRVINMFTLKPIDKELIIKSALETGAIVTAENHSIINGLGSAVSEVITDSVPVPVEKVGVYDKFGQVGPINYLKETYGLTFKNIVKSAEKAIKRKNN